MKLRIMAVICSLASLLAIAGSCAYGGQPGTQTDFSFGLTFYAMQSIPCPKYPKGLCLADSVPPCTPVALVSHTGICSVTALYRFHYDHPGGGDFEATVLEGSEECLRDATVAVLGVDTGAIRLISPKEDQSVRKDLESSARGLLKHWITAEDKSQERIGDIDQNPLSKAPPRLSTVGDITMLRFALNEAAEQVRTDGPILLFFKDQLFRLEAWCTGDPVFFSVNDKLHVAYRAVCCGCGERILYVYDLSGDAPKMVYENDKLSD
jgi:hypothetical protein